MCVKLVVRYNKTFFFFFELVEAEISLDRGDKCRDYKLWRDEL